MKRAISLLLVFVVVLSLFAACGKKVENKQGGIEQTYQDSTEELELLATELGSAVMLYDLMTLQLNGALSVEMQEEILADKLPYTEDGNLEWEGNTCDNFADFITIYDMYQDISYQSLNVQVDSVKVLDVAKATDFLQQADETEKLYRNEKEAAIYDELVDDLAIEKVAVVDLSIEYQFSDSTSPENGETMVSHEKQNACIRVVLVQIDGSWKSYTPTLAGAMPAGGFLQRYVTPAD